MIPPWFRTVGEPPDAYAAFLAFRDQAAPRSIYRVTLNHTLIRPAIAADWAKAYDWHARAAAYDDSLRDLRDREAAEIARLSSRDRARERERILNSTSELVARELGKMLAVANSSEMSTLKPETVLAKVPDIVKALRLEHGETTENVAGMGHDTCLDVSACNLEEINEIRAILDKARARADAEAAANGSDRRD